MISRARTRQPALTAYHVDWAVMKRESVACVPIMEVGLVPMRGNFVPPSAPAGVGGSPLISRARQTLLHTCLLDSSTAAEKQTLASLDAYFPSLPRPRLLHGERPAVEGDQACGR